MILLDRVHNVHVHAVRAKLLMRFCVADGRYRPPNMMATGVMCTVCTRCGRQRRGRGVPPRGVPQTQLLQLQWKLLRREKGKSEVAMTIMTPRVIAIRVRCHIIRHAHMENVGKSQSCMVSKLRIIWKQTAVEGRMGGEQDHQVRGARLGRARAVARRAEKLPGRLEQHRLLGNLRHHAPRAHARINICT